MAASPEINMTTETQQEAQRELHTDPQHTEQHAPDTQESEVAAESAPSSVKVEASEATSSSCADLYELRDVPSSPFVHSTSSPHTCTRLKEPTQTEPGEGISSSPIKSPNGKANESQVPGSSLLQQQSFEPRYSPSNTSAVSSSFVSPVAATFDRLRHPQSDSPNQTLSSPAATDDPSDHALTEETKNETNRERVPDENFRIPEFKFSKFIKECDDEGEDLVDVEMLEHKILRNLGLPYADYDEEDRSDSVQDSHPAAFSPLTQSPLPYASSPTNLPMSTTSSPGGARTPSGAHVQFATNAAIPGTPFENTMNYFKQFKGKENSPRKSRRNASLPEEIDELAKEAQQEGIEDDKEAWEKYKEIDFAVIDKVMEDEQAGDLIMADTPTKKATGVKVDEDQPGPVLEEEETYKEESENNGTVYEVSIPGHYDDAFHLKFRSKSSVEGTASFIRARGESLEASKEDIDHVVQEFLACPENFAVMDDDADTPRTEQDLRNRKREELERTIAVDVTRICPSANEHGLGDENQNPENDKVGSITHEKQDLDTDKVVSEHEDAHKKRQVANRKNPIFVKVIGMLPKTMFWVVAQPVAHYSYKALDTAGDAVNAALEKLTGLSLN